MGLQRQPAGAHFGDAFLLSHYLNTIKGMRDLMFAVFMLAGIGIGGFMAWLIYRYKFSAELLTLRANNEHQSILAAERLSERDRQIEELAKRLASSDAQLDCANTQLRKADVTLSAAQERNCKIPQLEAELDQSAQQVNALREEIITLRTKCSELESTLEAERIASTEKMQLLEGARTRLTEAFQAVSHQIAESNNRAFLQLAQASLEKFQERAEGNMQMRHQAIDALMKPIRDSLEQFDRKVQELESSRVGAYQGLAQQVKILIDAQVQLRAETASLVKALSMPKVRGRWGEMQLRRVVEMAGMMEHCDFFEQVSSEGEDGRVRPDLLVRLAGGKQIVVDAKAPLSAFLEAIEATSEADRKARMLDHARQIRNHVDSLSRKSYWDQFQPSPEFVVMFLPGESFFSAALEFDPSLIESGVEQRVILATPTTLIALLKAVAFGWKQEKMAANAHEVCCRGKELYKRIGDMAGHFRSVGSGLKRAVESYNQAIGSLEARVLVSARLFRDLSVAETGREIVPLPPLDRFPREAQASELLGPDTNRYDSVEPDSLK